MNKKTIAYILIGVAAVAGLWYLYTRYGKGSAASLGAGQPDTRGAWAADDDAAYKQMRDKLAAQDFGALGWVDPLVKADYEAGTKSVHKLNGGATKAGSFLAVFEAVNPNEKGKYMTGTDMKMPLGGDASTRQLWPESLHADLWNTFNNLKIKYGAL